MNKELVAGEILLELKGLRERLTVLERQLSEFMASEPVPVQSVEKPAPAQSVEAQSPARPLEAPVQAQPVAEPVAAPEPALEPTPAKPGPRKAPVDGRLISDLRRAIGLNDRFRFRKDLFGGDEGLMNETIDALDRMDSLADAMAYANERFDWSEDDETVRYLMDMLHRRFPD